MIVLGSLSSNTLCTILPKEYISPLIVQFNCNCVVSLLQLIGVQQSADLFSVHSLETPISRFDGNKITLKVGERYLIPRVCVCETLCIQQQIVMNELNCIWFPSVLSTGSVGWGMGLQLCKGEMWGMIRRMFLCYFSKKLTK